MSIENGDTGAGSGRPEGGACSGWVGRCGWAGRCDGGLVSIAEVGLGVDTVGEAAGKDCLSD